MKRRLQDALKLGLLPLFPLGTPLGVARLPAPRY